MFFIESLSLTIYEVKEKIIKMKNKDLCTTLLIVYVSVDSWIVDELRVHSEEKVYYVYVGICETDVIYHLPHA